MHASLPVPSPWWSQCQIIWRQVPWWQRFRAIQAVLLERSGKRVGSLWSAAPGCPLPHTLERGNGRSVCLKLDKVNWCFESRNVLLRRTGPGRRRLPLSPVSALKNLVQILHLICLGLGDSDELITQMSVESFCLIVKVMLHDDR